MAYTQQTWIDESTGGTPLSAARLGHMESGIGAVDTKLTNLGIVNVKDYGAKGDGVIDDTAAIQSALNAPGANGGLVIMPAGTYIVSSPVTVPNKVTLRGDGRSASMLQASASFPINSAVVNVGPVGALAFSSRLEQCTVNASSIAGSTCVSFDQGQEDCGLDTVVLGGFRQYGVVIKSGAADFGVQRMEVYPDSAGATYGVYVNGAGGTITVRDSTIGVSGSLTAGVYLNTCTALVANLHVEECTDGILWDNSAGAVLNVTGKTTADAIMANLVRMKNNTRYVCGFGLNPNSAPVTVKDEFFFATLTGFVTSWIGGDQYVARLHHNGDQLGFFGATGGNRPTVSGSRGGNAALASLLTGLAGLGLVQDSSTT